MRKIPSRVLLALILASGVVAPAVSSAASSEDAAASQPANAARPEFVKPFNEAQQLLKEGKGPDALAKLKEAAALPDLNPYEQFLLVRVRAPAEYAAGDKQGAINDFEAALASPQLPFEERLPLTKVLAGLYFDTDQYDKAIVWIDKFFAGGGTDARLHEAKAQALYQTKNYPAAAQAYQGLIDAEYAAGQKPTEQRLRVLRSAYGLSKDDAGVGKIDEHLAVDYPASAHRSEYWAALVSRASKVQTLNDRQYLDVYRLQAAINGTVADDQRLSYAELAKRAGYPSEAKRVLDDGFPKNAYTGADLTEAKKLDAEVTRAAAADKAQSAANETSARSAKDGNAAAGLGLLDVIDGNAQQGVALLNLAVEKGGLKYPDEVRLHLGIAQYNAGQLPDALKTFQAATGPTGMGQISHVWALFVQSKMQPASAPAAAASK